MGGTCIEQLKEVKKSKLNQSSAEKKKQNKEENAKKKQINFLV